MRLLQEMEDWVREANALTEVQWREMLTLVAAEERPKWLEDPLLGPDMVLRLQVLHVTATLTGLMERYYGAGSERHAYMHIPWWERKREP